MATPIESFTPDSAQGHFQNSDLSAGIHKELIQHKLAGKSGVTGDSSAPAAMDKSTTKDGAHGGIAGCPGGADAPPGGRDDMHLVIPPSSSIFDRPTHSSPDALLKSKGGTADAHATAGDGSTLKEYENLAKFDKTPKGADGKLHSANVDTNNGDDPPEGEGHPNIGGTPLAHGGAPGEKSVAHAVGPGDVLKKDPSDGIPTLFLKPGETLKIDVEGTGSHEFLTTGPTLKIFPGDSSNPGDGKTGDKEIKVIGPAVPLSNETGTWVDELFVPSYEAKGK